MLYSPPSRVAAPNGIAYAGAKLYFYTTGTETPATVYSDSSLTTAHSWPVSADNGGLFPAIYLSPSASYRALCKSAQGFKLFDHDPVHSSDPNEINVADYGAIGTSDDTAVFTAAYTAASTANKTLRLPPGTFNVSGLTWDEDGPTVVGAGAQETVFQATGNGQTVIRINRGAAVNRRRATHFSDFGIDLSGRDACIGLYTYRLVSSSVERIAVRGDDWPTNTRSNIGWKSEGDQYSTFNDIKVEYVANGFYMLDGGALVGGGINNNYANLLFSYAKLGAVIINKTGLPFGLNQFTNFKVQSTTHCALYLNGATGFTFEGLPPEACSGSGTVTFDGYTIKAGHIHATNGTNATFLHYNHSSSDAAMVIRSESKSHLKFDCSEGAKIQTYCDRDSTIEWDGSWGNGSQFRGTRLTGRKIGTNRTIVSVSDANIVVDGSFPTAADRGSPITGLVSNNTGLASGPTINGDSGLIAYQSVAFGAGVGGSGSNWIRIAMTVGSTVDKTKMNVAAILLRSSVDADYTVAFSNIVIGSTISLRAGEWTRVLIGDSDSSGTTVGYFDIWPVAAGGPTLDFCYPTLLGNPSANNLARFLREHVVNPRDAKGLVYTASAAPVAGTWPLGAVVWHSAPALGAPPFWECTAAGTPGTWKAAANLV